MSQMTMFHEDIYDALRDLVRALGGFKKVGPMLFPGKNGNADSYLKDCLNPDRRETLDPNELLLLLKWGKEIGCHSAMHYLCDLGGYQRAAPVNPPDEHAELQRAYIESVKFQKQLAERMEALHQDMPASLLKRAG